MSGRSDGHHAGTGSKRQRRRLPPEQRRRQLMEVAADIVATDGQGALTMERLAIKAGVSNGTVYLYFDNRADVLLALLEEHWLALDAEIAAARREAGSYEDLVRSAVEVYLRAVPRRGPAFRRLNYETSVEKVVEERRLARRAEFLTRVAAQHRREFGLSPTTARAAAEMLLGALEAGAELMAAKGAPPKVVEEVQVALVMGGLRALAANGKGSSPAKKSRRVAPR